jgi:hypothetical protein
MYVLSGANVHLIVVSFIVYIFVNMIENTIHYNIGRMNVDSNAKIELPTKIDFIKIFIVMITFASIQGFLTYYFNKIK